MATTKDHDLVNPSSFASLAPAIRSLCTLFKTSDVPGIIIGGVAASIHGQARATEDVDVAVLLDERHLNRFVKLAAVEGLYPRISDAIAFARRNAVLLLEHSESGVSVDIALGRLPFERYAIEHAIGVKIDDLVVPVVAPEDLIVMKAVAHRPQDLQDIRVIVTSNPKLDVRRIRREVRGMAGALDMPELWTDIAGLIQGSRSHSKKHRPKSGKGRLKKK
ncbi:MAG: nucleotidyl transferase AbiEii/AbiGii toxin family protein [Nitrospira sp.]|nr:nucleotidyl transferase AbiEii/AbiGii toxin family protein [Nitrospira sp.]